MPPSPDLIRVSLFRNGKAEFLTLLAESKAAYRIRVPEPDVIVNAGEMVEVLKATLGNAPWAALAYVLVAWIKGRANRKVIITKPDRTIVHLEGFALSEEQVAKILEGGSAVTVIQTDRDESNTG